MTNVFKYLLQCLCTHWFKGNSYILQGPEIKSHVTQVALTCGSVLTMMAFKNRCNVSALALTDWLLQPNQVLRHCEDRHHDLCGDWILRKRFSAGKEFCTSPSTPKLSNFKVIKKSPSICLWPSCSSRGLSKWWQVFDSEFPLPCLVVSSLLQVLLQLPLVWWFSAARGWGEVQARKSTGRALPRQQQPTVFVLSPLVGTYRI